MPVPVWAVVTFQPLFATVLTALSWFMSTASVPFTPGAMLVTVKPPPLIPVLVTLGPPVIVRPPLFNVELPVVTLVNVGVMLVASVMFEPFCVMATLLPAVNVAVPPGATLVTEVPLAVPVPVWAVVTFQPLLATVLTAAIA